MDGHTSIVGPAGSVHNGATQWWAWTCEPRGRVEDEIRHSSRPLCRRRKIRSNRFQDVVITKMKFFRERTTINKTILYPSENLSILSIKQTSKSCEQICFSTISVGKQYEKWLQKSIQNLTPDKMPNFEKSVRFAKTFS